MDVESQFQIVFFYSSVARTGAKAEPNLQKCHVTNLGAPNGHVNKHKIQMRSIFFFRGANSLVISVVLQCFVVNCS